MERRESGSPGLEVSAEGLGCMAVSELHGPTDETEAIATTRRALTAARATQPSVATLQVRSGMCSSGAACSQIASVVAVGDLSPAAST